jgi:protein TonB
MLQADASRAGARLEQSRQRTEPSPFARVYELGGFDLGRSSVAALVAVVLHVALDLWGLSSLRELGDFARGVKLGVEERLRRTIEIKLNAEPEPEPPPPEPTPEPEPPKVEAKPPPAPVKAPPRPAAAPPPPPAPAAAQAGKVITAAPDPDEPLDLTGNTFVQGNADAYAGGITASKGTSTEAVRSTRAHAEGVPGGAGTAAPSGVDRSRSANVTQHDWACPLPPEAVVQQINYQQVNVAVKVSESGKPLDVKVLGQPGFGFGPAAQRCAASKTFIPALDREGRPITTTIVVVVKFQPR